MPITTEVTGLMETQRKLEQVIADLQGAPMLNAMRDATLMVQATAKEEAPVDTGRLRASITPEVRGGPDEVVGAVGSNVDYAPYMELGTGTFAGKSAHFPPPAALDVWARRHGAPSGFVVARAIFMRGGLKPRRFLQIGFEKNESRIKAKIEGAVSEIVQK